MKPARIGTTGAGWQLNNNTTTSQIPLPLRRGSNKSDKGPESDAAEITDLPTTHKRKERSANRRTHPEKNSTKSSLLASSSFCCGSGQNEECISDIKVTYSRPPKKSRREQDKLGPDSLVTNGHAKRAAPTTRIRTLKVEKDVVEEKPKRENRLITDCPKVRGLPEKKSTRTNNLLSPMKKFAPEVTIDRGAGCYSPTLSQEMESGGTQKYTDVIRKLHKDPTNYTSNNLMPLNVESQKLCEKVENVKKLKSENAEEESHGISECTKVADDARGRGVDGAVSVTVIPSCDTEDLDCPCCNSEAEDTVADTSADKRDSLIDELSSALLYQMDVKSSVSTSLKEKDLEVEVRVLHENLESGRLNLKNQQRHIAELETEVRMIGQLKTELAKEKNMRREAEIKLLQLLGGQTSTVRLFSSRPESAPLSDTFEENGTSVITSYENRIRNYELYVTKLEENNEMLVNELRKLRDLSPNSQGEKAKLLLAKLTQLESDNRQQKIEYEKCLDEVANKLVHTLLVQKKIEEECRALHLRLEQLHQENTELLKFSHSIQDLQSQNIGNPMSSLPVACTIYSAELKDFKTSESPETARNCEKKSSVIEISSVASHRKSIASTPSPDEKPSGISQIPSCDISNRKRTKLKLSTLNQETTKTTRSTNHETIISKLIAPENNSFRKKVDSSSDKSPSDLKSQIQLRRISDSKSHANISVDSVKYSSSKRKRITKLKTENESSSNDTKIPPVFPEAKNSRKDKAPSPLCTGIVNKVSSKVLSGLPEIACPQVQKVWSCSVNSTTSSSLSEIMETPTDWKCNNFLKDGNSYIDFKVQGALEMVENKFISPLLENECSVSTEGTHRTKDEGYSTMSSEQQQDSVADTTVSGVEPSSTYVQSVSNMARDDSVTDCLDGSMTSSSDSGFGPLQQMSVPSQIHASGEPKSSSVDNASQNFGKNHISPISTYLEEFTDRNALAVISEQPSQSEPCNLGDSRITRFLPSESSIQHYSTIYLSGENAQSQVFSSPFTQKAQNICDFNQAHSTNNSSSGVDRIVTSEFSILGIHNVLIPSGIQSCSKTSIVETAEKATLTEPQEITWREKALAHFIDESIWSLYSSESDAQFKLVSNDPEKDFSPQQSVVNFSKSKLALDSVMPAEIDTVLFAMRNHYDLQHSGDVKPSGVTRNVMLAEDLDLLNNLNCYRPTVYCLERVASDSLLYQKDAVHELEDSMKPCLKTSRNFTTKIIPVFHHFSATDICNTESSLRTKVNIYPDVLLNLEKTMLLNNYVSPSSRIPSTTSSVCSLPSSNSYHLISDETDDVDLFLHSSRKGSQDPNLSSDSDAEYENLEHRDFVERWIRKEIVERDKDRVEISTCLQNVFCENRRSSLQRQNFSAENQSHCSSLIISDQNATRAGSAPFTCNNPSRSPKLSISYSNDVAISPSSSLVYPIIFTCENIADDPESASNGIELDLQSLDSEVKEFNDDFYRLCDVGSSLSIDYPLPPILQNIDDSLKSHSMQSPSVRYQFPQNEKPASNESPEIPKVTDDETISKPTIFVKPVRPVTLSFHSVPNPPAIHHFQKIDLSNTEGPNLVLPKQDAKEKTNTRRVRRESSPVMSRASFIKQYSIVNRQTGPISCSNSCTKEGDVLNFGCSYKLQPSLPANQNIEIPLRRPNTEKTSVAAPLATDHSSGRRNYNSPVATQSRSPLRAEPNGISPSNTTKACAVIPKHFHWRKDRFVARTSKEGCGTAWVHLQADSSLSDPKARASLLDSMAATLSSSGSSSEEEECDVLVVRSNTHLQKICREKRKRIKASRAGDLMAMSARHRSTVLNQQSLYFRFGEREKEAIACFDFLEDMPSSSSEPGNTETTSKRLTPPNQLNTGNERNYSNKERVNLLSPCTNAPDTSSRCWASSFTSRLKMPILWNQPIRRNMSSSTLNSQDHEILDHISLSDSCAESYTSTPDSFDDVYS